MARLCLQFDEACSESDCSETGDWRKEFSSILVLHFGVANICRHYCSFYAVFLFMFAKLCSFEVGFVVI